MHGKEEKSMIEKEKRSVEKINWHKEEDKGTGKNKIYVWGNENKDVTHERQNNCVKKGEGSKTDKRESKIKNWENGVQLVYYGDGNYMERKWEWKKKKYRTKMRYGKERES